MTTTRSQRRDQPQLVLPHKFRELSVVDLANMRESTAYSWLKRIRWPETEGEPYCPKCRNRRCYTMSRGRFKCSDKSCGATFTATSGTVFHARKLDFRRMMIAIWYSANPGRGLVALQLSRVIGVNYRTAWGLRDKLRGAVTWATEEPDLEGSLDAQRKSWGTSVRPASRAEVLRSRRRGGNRKTEEATPLWPRHRGGGRGRHNSIVVSSHDN